MRFSFTDTIYLVRQQYVATRDMINTEPIEVLVEAEYLSGAISGLEIWSSDKANEEMITNSLPTKVVNYLSDKALYRAMRHA